MVTVELKPLLGRLDRACTRALEAAAGLCISRGHHEITIEHLLLRMLDDATGDVAFVVSRFDVDPERLRRSLQGAVDGLPGGHSGKPVFSPLILELIQDGWMIASIDEGLAAVRTGSLLAAIAARPARYLTADHPELAKIRADELRRDFRAIVQGSSEDDAPAAPGAHALAGERAARGEPSALARFATDFTAAARAGRIDPVFGRDREIRQTIDILGRRRKNNPIIVGEAGVGKTAIVEGLALRVAEGDVPELLHGVAIWGLDLGLLQAGAGVKGEFESRLKAVIEEVKAASTRIILFIDEAHMLIGAGSAAGSGDAANLLKPALARGELRTIAATTWAEYKQYFEEDSALARRFQPVKIDEPSIDDAALMLRGLKARYEAAHGVTVRDDAIDAAVRLSARYITGRLLPDKAVDLLDTAAARVHIGQTAKPAPVEDLERRIGALGREQEAIERDRRGGARVDEERLTATARGLVTAKAELAGVTARWKEQQAAVQRVLGLRRAPGGERELADALAALARAQEGGRMVRLEVDPDVMAQVVEDWTGVPVGRMIEDEASRVAELEARLGERIKGQPHAVKRVAEALRAARMGLGDPRKPQVFLLVGPSGVGKTELGLAVADALFGGERFVVTINMSEYQDREMGVSGLIGAKPGYVGYGKGGALTEAVRQRPYSVVLLDEVEKAGQEVRNLFYQVFDKGELTDGTGRKIDFKNTVLFLTTNLGAEIIQELCAGASPPAPAEVTEAILPLLRRALHPAWLARTTVVPFYSLPRAALSAITELKLGALGRRLRDAHKVELSVTPEVVEAITARCTDVETGARNIDFILGGSLLPRISAALLAGLAERAAGTRMVVGLDAAGLFTATLTG